jgi:hypothetical protein
VICFPIRVNPRYPRNPRLCFNRLDVEQHCAICEKQDIEVYRLVKCPVCFKWICEECAVRLYGRYFCSRSCAANFFFDVDEM